MIKISAVIFVSVLTSVFAASSLAGENFYYLCTKDDVKKTIAVVYENKSSNVPCKVRYTKQDKTKTLWHAQSKQGYCEDKAAQFATKQNGKGWHCQKQ